MEGISSISTNLNQSDDIIRKGIETLFNSYKIDLKSLSNIVNVDYNWLKGFMEGKNKLVDFSEHIINFNQNNKEDINNSTAPSFFSLSNIIFMLSDGIAMVDEDDRVKGIIGVLFEYGIKDETLAIYSKLSLEDVHSFMQDTKSISYEKKYKLAVSSIFLFSLFKR